jgi:hypothetical protein
MIDNGIGVSMKTSTNGEGLDTNIGIIETESKGTGTLTFSKPSHQRLAFQRGRQTKKITTNVITPIALQVLKGDFLPVPLGKRGSNIKVDTPTQAWRQDPKTGLSEILNQQAFATPTPLAPNSFAIGENRALRFSDDLVKSRSFVWLAPATTQEVTTISEERLGYLKLLAVAISDDNTVDYLTIENFLVDPSGSGVNIKGDNLQVKIVLTPLGGACEAYSLVSSKEELFCEN